MLDAIFSKGLVGLDIGSMMIKAMQFKGTGENRKLAAAGVAELSQEVIDGMEEDMRETLVAETIKKLFKDNNIRTKNVVTSLSGDDVIVRPVKLPYIPPEELPDVIAYEAENYIPLAIDQVVLDYEVLGEVEEGEGQKKISLVLVAAKEEVVDKHLQLVHAAGLNPVIIDVDCYALQNAFQDNVEVAEDETVALVDIGANVTNVNILDGQTTQLSRDITIGGNEFTKEVQREFNLSFSQAEELKRQQGRVIIESDDISLSALPSQDDRSLRISEALNPVLNKLLSELRRMFDFYETSGGQRNISRISISGGGAKLLNIDKYLNNKLGIPVDECDIFSKLQIDSKSFDVEDIKSKMDLFGVSYGLAMRRGKKKKIKGASV